MFNSRQLDVCRLIDFCFHQFPLCIQISICLSVARAFIDALSNRVDFHRTLRFYFRFILSPQLCIVKSASQIGRFSYPCTYAHTMRPMHCCFMHFWRSPNTHNSLPLFTTRFLSSSSIHVSSSVHWPPRRSSITYRNVFARPKFHFFRDSKVFCLK